MLRHLSLPGALLMAMTTSGLSCAQGKNMILEAKDVQFFKAVELPTQPVVSLRLSGLAFHSALAVEQCTTITEGDSLVVLVHLVRARAGMSGNFECTCPIPPNINTVKFGNARTPVWARGRGALL